MSPSSTELMDIAVHIGEVKQGASDQCLRAILGSCIGLIFIDVSNRAFTMSHSLLPLSTAPEHRFNARWVDQAIEAALKLLKTPPSEYQNLQAIVAGGALMMSATRSEQKSVGELNVEAALEGLREKGIPIIATETGGTNGRSISVSGNTLAYQIDKIPRFE